VGLGTVVAMKRSSIVWLGLAAAALACGNVSAAPANSIVLDGDTGCETLEVQQMRWDSLRTATQISLAKQQGRATPEQLEAEKAAIVRFTDLSREKCRRLAGPFKVLERRTYSGISIVRVVFGGGALWVLQSEGASPTR
jgi:hypothetical protein